MIRLRPFQLGDAPALRAVHTTAIREFACRRLHAGADRRLGAAGMGWCRHAIDGVELENASMRRAVGAA
jgi:hypothetical protein